MATTAVRVEIDGVHRGHDHGHADGDWDEKFDHVASAVLQLELVETVIVFGVWKRGEFYRFLTHFPTNYENFMVSLPKLRKAIFPQPH